VLKRIVTPWYNKVSPYIFLKWRPQGIQLKAKLRDVIVQMLEKNGLKVGFKLQLLKKTLCHKHVRNISQRIVDVTQETVNCWFKG
jgi:CRISPR/Cas system endoribonuclease Cas6 (RAMP superfamily)